MLALPIYLSFLGVLVLTLLPRTAVTAARTIALLTAVAGFAVSLGVAATYNADASAVTLVKVTWIKSLGIHYLLGFDGISLTLVLLTGLAAVTGILFSWNIGYRTKEFFAFFLALIGGVYGVFLSFDVFLLFVFYEIAIIPKYFLIAIWGSTRKEYGAMKLVLYSFVGSAMVLVGLIAAVVVAHAQTGVYTFDLNALAKVKFPISFQMWAFPLVFVGFGILAGLWPFHTWAPTGHVAAPTAASMLLAGVVMKLGAYGCLRVAMTLFPLGLSRWASPHLGFGSWQDVFAVLAVIGIVYGALVALVQKDFKFVIGYSSVSHMGFVLLGLMTLSLTGLSGAVLQMFSHGIIAGLLFAVVGRMVYDRTHTRDFAHLEGLGLSQAIPFAAVTFVVAGVASMGLPGFSGFVAELQVLIGAWSAYPTLTLICGIGILVGVAYTLRAIQKAFFADTAHAPAGGASVPLTPALSPEERENPGQRGDGATDARTGKTHEELSPLPGGEGQGEGKHGLEPISLPERIAAMILIATTVVIGLYPRLLLDFIVPALGSPLFDGLRKGGLS